MALKYQKAEQIEENQGSISCDSWTIAEIKKSTSMNISVLSVNSSSKLVLIVNN